MWLKKKIEKLKDWACAKDCGMCPWCYEAEYGERFCPFDGVIKAAEERAKARGNKELIAHAKEIRKYCNTKRLCNDCPFFRIDIGCKFKFSTPDAWTFSGIREKKARISND